MARRFMFPFGVGRLYLQAPAQLDYSEFGVAALQEGGFGIEMDIKELHGRDRFPVDVRTGKGKITGNAKYADWDPDVIALILGVTVSTSSLHALVIREAGTIGASPFHITVAQSATWVKSIDVLYASDGTKLVQVASGPITGQYSVASGVYTFAAADTGLAVLLSYMYSPVSGGKQITWGNVAIGTTPVCKGIFQGIHDADQMVLELTNVIPYGMKTASKTDDWMMIDSNMSAFADPQTGSIGVINIIAS